MAGCSGEPEWKRAYEDCKSRVESRMQSMKDRGSTGDPRADALHESLDRMGRDLALSACEMIRQSCEDDPGGHACEAIVEGYRSGE